MSSNPTRSWLLTQPRPASVNLTLASGEVRKLPVAPAPNWAKVAQTIDAMQPTLIEALDAAGNLLRATSPGLVDDTEVEPEDPSTESERNAKPSSSDVPLEVFARLLAQAYAHSTDVAFSRMVDLFAAVNRRSEALERSLDATHKMLRRAWEEQIAVQAEVAQAQAATEDPLKDLVGAFVGGQAQAAVAKHVNGANGANGKAT